MRSISLSTSSVLQHDAFSCNSPSFAPHGTLGFPSKRKGGEHVGSIFKTENASERAVDVQMLKRGLASQPPQCVDRERGATLLSPGSVGPGASTVAVIESDGWIRCVFKPGPAVS